MPFGDFGNWKPKNFVRPGCRVADICICRRGSASIAIGRGGGEASMNLHIFVSFLLLLRHYKQILLNYGKQYVRSHILHWTVLYSTLWSTARIMRHAHTRIRIICKRIGYMENRYGYMLRMRADGLLYKIPQEPRIHEL